ncbi:MAG: hypothetical protein U0W24_09605 [Bacteroidales bacterium]
MLKEIKQIKTGLAVLTIVFVLVMLLVVLDFLALHDIKQDYVSRNVVNTASKGLNLLPPWSETTGEWRAVYNSLYTKFLTSFFCIFFIIYLKRKVNKIAPKE